MTSLCEESANRVSNSNGYNGTDVMSTVRHRRHRKQHYKQSEATLSSSLMTPSDDDAASVCSGVSSASGSSGGGGKVGKKQRRGDRGTVKRSPQHCLLHGCTDGVINTNNNSCEIDVKCTCQKHSRRQIMARRPEPEGGTAQQCYKSTMDEFDRLIYGPSEPLFSDCDCLDDDGLAELPESKSISQSRSLGGTDDVAAVDLLFKTAQVINTNTLMKIAIIQTELKNVKDASLRRLGNDLATVGRRLDGLNDSCNQTEPNMDTLRQQLYETRTQLINTNSNVMLTQHNCNCDKRTSKSTYNLRRHATPLEFYSNPLIPSDVDIETFAANIDSSELRVTNLEDQLKSVVKSTSQSNEKEIRDVTLRLKEAEQSSLRAEQQLFNARYTTDRLSEEWCLNLKKHQPIANTLRSVSFADVINC